MKRFWSVFTARNLEFLRDRSALGWNLVWPVLMVLGLAFLFSGEQQDVYKVGVYPANAVSENHEFSFFGTEFVHFIPVEQLDEAIAKVERHRLDMLIDFSNPMRYWINSTSTNGYFLEKLLLASRVQSDSIAELAGAFNVIEIPEKQIVTGSEIRYVDWVLPGVLAVNMMFSCLFGIGYVIVRYRKNRVLRRLKATPLLPFEFLAAQVLSRLLIIMVITVIVYIACDLFIDFYMRGSLLDLFIVFTIGSLSLISMGLLVAARIKSEELSSGILNVIS
ncbi:ABC transporter permease, partial [Kaarinaea lacus]